MSNENDTHFESTAGRGILAAAIAVAVASAVYQFVSDQGEPGVRFLLLALVAAAIWWAKVPAAFAAAFAVFSLVATWAAAEHWYRDIAWADEVIHFFTPGSLAAAAYFLLVRLQVLPSAEQSRMFLRSWTPVVWVMLVGVFAAVLWEFYEWVVEKFTSQSIIVGYTDTLSDLLVGALGCLTAGALVVWWARWQQAHRNRTEGSDERGPAHA